MFRLCGGNRAGKIYSLREQNALERATKEGDSPVHEVRAIKTRTLSRAEHEKFRLN